MKKLIVLILSAIFFIGSQAQDEIILTVGNEKISKTEFERVYLKNNKANTPDKKSISEYLDLYVNFRLKVLEAKANGLDTLETFTSELNGYRDQLAKPYLNDTNAVEDLLKEAYERMKWEISTNLILVKCDPTASPKDSLIAYKKIMALRDRIVKKKEAFEKVASEGSEDEYAKYNGGFYGYSVAFRYPYIMETAIYNTPVGGVTNPIRTKWGYFIAKVNDKRPMRGDVKVSHIMKLVPNGASKETIDSASMIINDVYKQLKAGANFEEMVQKYSDDRYSVQMNGELPMFHTGQMVETFEDSAFALKKPGDISHPCRTEYGWHIIKLIEYKPIESYEVVRSTLKDQIMRDDRAVMPQAIMVAKLKKQYGFSENIKSLEPLKKMIDSTIFRNDWNPERAENMKEMLIKIGDKKYSQHDFAKYIVNPANRKSISSIDILVQDSYAKYVNDMVLEYHKEQLPSLYPEFKNIMQEYHDGILLFNITDQKVWSKAIRDTLGLQAFYETVKQKYLWKDRMKVSIYSCNDKKTVAALQKILSKDKEYQLTIDQINDKLCVKDSIKKCITVKSGTFEKGENPIVDEQEWKIGLSKPIEKEGKFILVVKKEIIPSTPKLLSEARGFIIADYQSSLEEKWIKELREKYPILINKDSLKSLESKYNK